MREINNTIYEILKMSGPEDDVSVTQLITDEVIKKSVSGEVKPQKKEDATGILDRKALDLDTEKKESTNTGVRRQIKASGKKTVAGQKGTAKTNPTRKVSKVAKTKKVEKNSIDITKILLVIVLVGVAAYIYMNFS